MTVSYTSEVASCRGFGCFIKLLFRWKGSIYKLVWLDLLAFLFVYFLLNFTYRWVLDEEGQKIFEGVVAYCLKYSDFIPLSFVLGFYVSIVMTRWWEQWINIPWPDNMAVYVSTSVRGLDERGRVMRRTIMRYVCLCLTMVFTMIAPKVKKRFPTLDHLVEAGLLQESEKNIIEDLNQMFPNHPKHWMPLVWAASIVTKARTEGRIRDDFALKTLIDELTSFRSSCGLLLSYDMISVPLVYTQVVTLAVYSYFATAVLGRQWTRSTDKDSVDAISYIIDSINFYFPVFVCLQFFFYMGWLKVAESLINPFGDDDDDFEISWMIDRDIQVSYLIVDEMHHNHPELIRDQYWDDKFPTGLPYTVGTEKNRETVPLSSTANMEIPLEQQLITDPSSVKIDEMGRVPTFKTKQSTVSVGNTGLPSSMGRNSVGSVLKKMFSRDDISKYPAADADGSADSKTLILGPGATRTTISERVTERLIEPKITMYESSTEGMVESRTTMSGSVTESPVEHKTTTFGSVTESPVEHKTTTFGSVTESPVEHKTTTFGSVTESPVEHKTTTFGSVTESPVEHKTTTFGSVTESPVEHKTTTFGSVTESPVEPRTSMSGSGAEGPVEPRTATSESLIERPADGSARVTNEVIQELDEQDDMANDTTNKDERSK